VSQISVILPTLRRDPRFCEMADSLARAVGVLRAAGHRGELQWVIVDGRLWYDDPDRRREEVKDAVRGRFQVKHVEPKPSVWQGPYRLTRHDLWDKASASNTGLCYAEAPVVVFVDDCSVFNDAFLLHHYETVVHNRAACGSYRHVLPGATIEHGRLVDAVCEEPGDHRRDTPKGLCPPGWMYGMNASCPLEVALAVNGFDEIMSGQGGLEDCEFGMRIARVVPLWFLPDAIAYQLSGTHEAIAGYHASENPCTCGHKRTEHPSLRCLICPCLVYTCSTEPLYKGYRYRDAAGVEHRMSANFRPVLRLQGQRLAERADGFWEHVHDDQLAGEMRRTTTVGNRFNLRDLRVHLAASKYFPVPAEPKTDWRDGQRLEEM
jgi:hypothetical protein